MSLADLPPGTDLCQIPVVKPPPGVIPNLVNPESTAGPAIGVTVLFTVLMLFFVCVRLYTKFVVSRSKGWDDCRFPENLRHISIADQYARHLHIGLCERRCFSLSANNTLTTILSVVLSHTWQLSLMVRLPACTWPTVLTIASGRPWLLCTYLELSSV